MSVRKYNRQSEGHYDKICLPNENDKYLLKSHQKAVYNDVLSSSKERNSPHGSHNGPSSKRLDYSVLQSKNSSKSSHSSGFQKTRDNDSPSTDRHGNSSSRYGKSHDNIANDDFEWTVHTSSSGKMYYYNRRTEKSQWEKPKEWIERENKLRSRDREKEREKEREREKRAREAGNQESREQSKYAKISPFKKEHISNRGSTQSRRTAEYSEIERAKTVQTHGSSTSAVSTASSRSSGCPTPDTIGSPIGSVQDISPPSTPSNSGVSSLSPYVNSSTANSIASPHIFTSSPGVSSAAQSSHPTAAGYQSYYRYPESKSYSTVSSQASSQNSSYAGYQTQQNSSEGTNVTSPTPALHPLQQAMLLQQQQQQQLVQSMYGCMTSSQSPFGVSPNVHEQKNRNEAGPPPPPPQHPQNVVATPPPPPPPNQVDGSPLTPVGYQSSRYRDPRSERTDQRPDPRSTAGKNAYGQTQELSYATGSLDNGSSENTRRETKAPEAPLPELSDLASYTQFCCRKAYEDIAGWMGSIFERQAAIASIEVDTCLGLAGERSKSNFLLSSMTSLIAESRHQVSSSRTRCLCEVLDQVEGLQDSRIERQDSRLERQDSKPKRHDSDRTDSKSAASDSKSAASDSKSDRKDVRTERKDLKTERKDSQS